MSQQFQPDIPPPPAVTSYAAVVAGGPRRPSSNLEIAEQVPRGGMGMGMVPLGRDEGTSARMKMAVVSQVPLVSAPVSSPFPGGMGEGEHTPPFEGGGMGGGAHPPPYTGGGGMGGAMTGYSPPYAGGGAPSGHPPPPPYEGRGVRQSLPGGAGAVGRTVGDNPFLGRAMSKPTAASTSSTTLHLKGVPAQLNSAAFLSQHFGRFGQVRVKCYATKMCATVAFKTRVRKMINSSHLLISMFC